MGMRTGAINALSGVDQWLGVLAGNLTGSNVNGFRAQDVEFKDVLAQQISAGSPQLQNGGSAIPPMQVSDSGATLAAVETDFSQGSLQTTNQPTDLGISGDGMFVLSKVAHPTSLKDLVFTRNGSFHFDFLTTGTTMPDGTPGTVGTYRLVNQDGLFVMGMQSDWTTAYKSNAAANLPGTPVYPKEGAFSDNTPLNNPVSQANNVGGMFGTGFQFKPIEIPFQSPTNPGETSLNSDFTPKFDASGWVTNSSENSDAPAAPTSTAANPVHRVAFVAIAKFADPQGLVKDGGSTNFDWNAVAGQFFLGVAGHADAFTTPTDPTSPQVPTNVGATNTINPGTIEVSNASVNTTLPELTIAQKSFSADVKIVQIGNEMIDDINNLVK